MKNLSFARLASKVALLVMLGLPELAGAQFFNYNQYGDVLAGFRKTGVNEGNYELVVDLGNVTNFVALSVGTTINITNYSSGQLTNAFIDTGDFANLQWSAFAAFPGTSPWVTPLGSFPKDTLWYTQPATDVNTQSQPPYRDSYNVQNSTKQLINGVGSGALSIANYLAVTNVNNNKFLVREPVTYANYILTAYIGDYYDPTIGDFGANQTPLPYIVENTTPDPFTSAQRDDFYQLCPNGLTDPINGSTTNTYYVGYFLLNPNGSMTFTRAAQTAAAPAASFTGGPTNGFAGFSAMFTNNSTGTITNWVWNFGDGTIITNTTGTNVTHTYASGGNYNVTLTVLGPGGVNFQTQPGFIMVSPLPTMITHVYLAGGQFVLSGSNCPAGGQYRILGTTNISLPLASWTPLVTNSFLSNGTYSFTNPVTLKAGFFRLASP